jgi:hypothetical protein
MCEEEQRLRVFGNRVLREVLYSERRWQKSGRRSHNEELYALYFSPKILFG